MPSLSESRIQHFLDRAQLVLYMHEHSAQARDPSYQEVLEFVEELVELVTEVRREREVLERIARLGERCQAADPQEALALARSMSVAAQRVLGTGPEAAMAPAPRAVVALAH